MGKRQRELPPGFRFGTALTQRSLENGDGVCARDESSRRVLGGCQGALGLVSLTRRRLFKRSSRRDGSHPRGWLRLLRVFV